LATGVVPSGAKTCPEISSLTPGSRASAITPVEETLAGGCGIGGPLPAWIAGTIAASSNSVERALNGGFMGNLLSDFEVFVPILELPGKDAPISHRVNTSMR
jgi:hypothetical protein